MKQILIFVSVLAVVLSQDIIDHQRVKECFKDSDCGNPIHKKCEEWRCVYINPWIDNNSDEEKVPSNADTECHSR